MDQFVNRVTSSDQVPLIALPTDQARQKVTSFSSEEQSISVTCSEELNQVACQAGVEPSTVLLAAYSVFIHRYSSQDELIIGLMDTDPFQMIHFDYSEDVSFRQVLKQLKHCLQKKDLARERLLEKEPVQLLFHSTKHQTGMNEKVRDGYDLLMVCRFEKEIVDISFLYNGQLFDDSTVARMLMNFQVLLQGALSTPERAVGLLPLLGEAEVHKLLIEWNETDHPYPTTACIHDLFEYTAFHNPDRIALEFEKQKLTYYQLEERANRLAHYLRKQGVEVGVKVAICMERTPEMVIALLGVLKAGGTYVPLDPTFPKERLTYMLENSSSRVVLSDQPFISSLVQPDVQSINIKTVAVEIAAESGERPAIQVSSDQTAFVIYTSGSTGKPKGVQVTHRSLVNLLTQAEKEPGICADDRFLAVTTLSFDICALELFLPLKVGATIVLVRREVVMDGERLARVIETSEATIMQGTPTMWRLLLASGWEGSPRLKVLCAGEPLTNELAQKLQECSAELWNLYGPTETTVWSTVHHVTEQKGPIPIGRPVMNTKLYVLDAKMQPVPIGVSGELYIGGDGVSQGYLNRPDLTAERFLPNPFTGKGWIYRTGDLARYLSDGKLECLGRMDHQVKLRGYRIELSEIEVVLQQHPAVGQAVVIDYEDEVGDKRLIAYLLPAGESLPADRELRNHCFTQLPEYMVPSAYVELDEIPLTPNRKVDRRALPAPDPTHIKGKDDITLPRTPVEKKLAAIFSELLHVEAVDIHDSFFDIGGHSLLATRLISRMYDEFQVKLPIQSLFQLKSVEKLSRRIEQAWMNGNETEDHSLRRIPRDGKLRLSFAQQRMWFLHRLNPESTAYHIPTVMQLEGSLDTEVLMESIREIIRRHESFRTRFCEVEGEPVQEILEPTEFEVPLIHLRQADRDQVYRLAKKLVDDPFDLSQGPLFRGALVQISEQEHYLVWVVHHIISDGWSAELFKKELATLYRAFLTGESSALPELPIQYADYAHWQQEWMKGSVMRQQLRYWKKQLSGTPPLLQLPVDRPRPAMQSFRGAIHRFSIAKGLYEQIKQLSHEADTTLFMTLFASFNTLLHRYSGQEDLWVGSAIANRNRTEIEELMGFFVNTLVLRTDFSGNPTFQDLLKQVRDVALQAYENQDVPFERLVEELQPERDLSYSPLFQVMFVMQNTPVEEVDAPELKIRRTEFDSETAKFDLTMFVTDKEEELLVSLEYNTDLFDTATIERMASHFCCLLRGIVANPQRRVGELPLLTQEEREWILSEWNDTEEEFPQELLHDRFAAIAQQMPEQIAVEADGVTL
ncbi:non-ribosomal peptide synthetase, partial [Kroppenstedtia guangzhouensis]|uniref:non-ribosomal peptide synthetase n=1 Tax=Kroppenstedtia guangzhouensis TaxID=1274356 RepID=UPI00166E74B8